MNKEHQEISSQQGLIIETCCNRACLILAGFDCPPIVRELEGGSLLSKFLGKEVQDILQQHPSFHADFVAVGTGPGSYTGIRVGAAMAKALAFGWQVPLIGFCSLQAFTPSQMGPFAILLDARMGGIYCLAGERLENDVRFEEPRLLTIDEVPQIPSSLFSPHPADIQKRIGSDRIVQTAAIDAGFLAAECRKRVQNERPSPLSPIPLTYVSSPVLAGKTQNHL